MLFTFSTTVELTEQDQDNLILPRGLDEATIVCCFHIVEEVTPAGVYRWYDELETVGAVVTDGLTILSLSLHNAEELTIRFQDAIKEELEWTHLVQHVEGNSTV
tara:strand:+ start:1135 stop:1446 length:312 start_codon:yes stop_codon:yes gene_type:complete